MVGMEEEATVVTKVDLEEAAGLFVEGGGVGSGDGGGNGG